MSNKPSLQDAFARYKEQETELFEKYSGKYILICGDETLAPFDSQLDALAVGKARFEPGTFLIQLCSPGADVQTFHTRVAFG